MTNLVELTTRQSDQWLRAIEQCAPYDFYHLPQYHAMAENGGEGDARLLVYTEGNHVIALPILLRCLDGFEGSALIGTGWMDATSVYGYAGPIASAETIPAAVAANFQEALRERLREWRVVTVFSRFHPFLSQRPLVAGLGDFQVSHTVSIDLTLPIAAQRNGYRKSFKEAISKQRRIGLTVVRDLDGSYLETFVEIYHETMRRLKAARRYLFPASYFTALGETLGSRLHLFMGLHHGRPVCGGLFVACHGILQFHLQGTLNDSLYLSPMKLLVDEVRLWGAAQEMQVLHLGGGATVDPNDSLLHFKQGFSDRLHEFAAWRWVVAPEQDALLRAEHARKLARQGLRPAVANYFPAYRCPAAACDRVASTGADEESSNTLRLLFSGGAS
jgi:Acetyltransferase (GNAT) domain